MRDPGELLEENVMSKPKPEEIFLKDKLEEQLNVSVKHNTCGNDPPDLEFELNGKLIGIEVTQIMKKVSNKITMLWLKNNLPKIIEPCLEEFEKKYARDIRKTGETRCFGWGLDWGGFMDMESASTETFSTIKDIQKTVIQGLKVIFVLPGVENERFFFDKNNLLQLNEFWAGNFPSAPIDGGFVTKYSNCSWGIKIKKGFWLHIGCDSYKDTVTVPDDKLFDDSLLVGIKEGAVIANKEYAPFKNYIQEAIQEKKKSGLKKLGQRKSDKYEEMWLYLYEGINPFLFLVSKREEVKAMSFDFENYWSKVCIFTDHTCVVTPERCISLSGDQWYMSLGGDQRYKK